jgi:hypothetical protein
MATKKTKAKAIKPAKTSGFTIDWKIFLLAAALFAGYKFKDDIKLAVPNLGGEVKEVVIVDTKNRPNPVVAPALQSLTQPLTTSLNAGAPGRDKKADALLLGDLCGDFAKVVIQPNDAVKTNADLRKAWNKFLILNAHASGSGFKATDYNDPARTMDSILLSYLGDDQKPIDNVKVMEVFTAMQGAFYASARL